MAFVRHLHRLGWDSTVLTVEPVNEPLDGDLLRRIPPSTVVIRTPWVDLIDSLKHLRNVNASTSHSGLANRQSPIGNRQGLREWFSRFLITPDSRLGWIPPAVRAGLEAVRHRRPEVLYSTSPYMSSHLIALILHRYTRIPWVADFRDPWVDNPFRQLGFPSLRVWDSFLEWMVLRSASRVVCNTPTMTETLCRRRPWVARKCATIMNGIDGDLMGGITPIRVASAKDLVLTHCGQFYGPRSPRVWFAALARIRRESPATADQLRLVLVGPDSYNGRPLRDWADEAGVADRVHVVGPKCHDETLAYMAGSDALILSAPSGPGDDRQIPNKLFEYLGVQKPILAAVPTNSPIAAVLREARAEAICCPSDDERAIADAVTDLMLRPRRAASDAWSGVGRFDRAHRAGELEGLFRQVARVRRTRSGRVLATGEKSARSALPPASPERSKPVDHERVRLPLTSDGGFRAVAR